MFNMIIQTMVIFFIVTPSNLSQWDLSTI